jgi:hypothetical protein
MEWYEIVPQWVTAIGTILAVVVALFQKLFKDWYNRPIIEITCKDNNQCKVEINSGTESSDSSSEIRIRVKLENKGNYIANHAAMFVDTIYKKREKEETYVKNEFTPKQIKDFRNTKPSSIAPHLQYYFDVASVHQYDSMATEDQHGKQKQFYKLYLLGEGDNIELGKGSFIIPLKFYSSRISVKIAYLKLFWDSDNYTTNKQNFDFGIITENEFKKIKIVE